MKMDSSGYRRFWEKIKLRDFLTQPAWKLAEQLRAGTLTSTELTQACLDRIAAVEPKVHAFLSLDPQGALETAAEVDRRRAAGEELHPMAGVPIALKDNIVVRGKPTTCASKILEGWCSPYDATVVKRLKAALIPIVGKTNLDEFAMGSSTEHSAYGPTHNPWDLERIPGGSGGGSAAAVGAYEVPWALGTDTGGSIRQPGANTGTVGAKPTYGAVSRYGVVALASSLDQVGPAVRCVRDAALLQELIGGHDPLDSTSLTGLDQGLEDAVLANENGVKGLKVGVIKELTGEGFQAETQAAFNQAIELLRAGGAEIIEISCPSFEYALAAYYLIMPAELSSNMARFDGLRYGVRVEPATGPVTAERVMAATRGALFGDEVKRRIILGTYVLSAGYYDAYYGSAQKVRTLVQRDFASAFSQVDVLVSPTAPHTAVKIGEHDNDLLAMYLGDIATIPTNLGGLPAISVPCGLGANNMPVGFQLQAPAKQDAKMYAAAAWLETLLEAQGILPLDCPAKRWEENA